MLGDDPRAVVSFGDVRRQGDGTELGRRRLDPLRTARDERQVEALLLQHPRDREPDAR